MTTPAALRAHLVAANRALHDEIAETIEVLRIGQDVAARLIAELETGRPVAEITDEVRLGENRARVTASVAAMESARGIARRHMFRALAAEGMSIGEIARRFGISRQLASRTLHDPPVHGVTPHGDE